MSVMGFGFLVIPIPTGVACGLTKSIKVLYEICKSMINLSIRRDHNQLSYYKIFSKNYTADVYKTMKQIRRKMVLHLILLQKTVVGNNNQSFLETKV